MMVPFTVNKENILPGCEELRLPQNGKHQKKKIEFKKEKEKQACVCVCVCSPRPVSGKEKRQQQAGLDATEDPIPGKEFKTAPHEKDKESYRFTNASILRP